VRRSLRDFDTWSAGRAEIKRALTPEELAEGQRVLFASHAERWQKEGRRGVFASVLFRTFHQRLMPELLRRGQLDLRWMVVDGRPLAALYNYVYAGRVHFYQGGRVLDLPKHLRPGIVLHASAIRDAIDAGHREYDFLAGTSRYKQQLSLAIRPMTHLSVERPSVRRSLTRVATSWKDWARPLPNPAP
jgi:CelD/BcsL family acetyltransferase involved in cellulose biosynthesis